jgi:hypothetical protein
MHSEESMVSRKRSARWWKKQTEAWERVREEVTARAFAEGLGVSPGTFSWWRCELRRRERRECRSLIPVEVL